MTDYEKDSMLLANSTINRLDTRRNDGLNQTSLNVLNVKKQHKTHTQRQFQEYGKQQIHQQQQQMMHLRQQKSNNNLYGIQNNRVRGSNSTMSFQSQSSHNDMNYLNPGTSTMYANSRHSNSQHSFNNNNRQNSLAQGGQWYNNNGSQRAVPYGSEYGHDVVSGDDNYDGFSNYTSTPDLRGSITNGVWGNNQDELVKELEEENNMLMEDIKRFQEFRELNEVLIEENEILREKLEILKENNEISSKSIKVDEEMSNKFQQINEEKIKLKQSSEDYLLQIALLTKGKESFELQLESMAQEITKLKLLNIENKKSKDKQIENLKAENDSLNKELDVFYQKEESALTSLESTPKSSVSTTPNSSDSSEISDIPPTAFKLPPQPIAQTQRTPPQTSTKTFPNYAYTNEELINDLLLTVKQLKSDNEILQKQKDNISHNLTKQKKLVKKFAGSRPYGKVKLRSGLSIVESIEILV